MEDDPKADNGIFDEASDFLSKIIEIPPKNSPPFLKAILRNYNEDIKLVITDFNSLDNCGLIEILIKAYFIVLLIIITLLFY